MNIVAIATFETERSSFGNMSSLISIIEIGHVSNKKLNDIIRNMKFISIFQ